MASQTYGLEHLEFDSFGKIYRNLTVQKLVEHEYQNGEGKFGPKGAVMVNTGEYTGKRPKCKFYVDEPNTTDTVWWGTGNKKITLGNYNRVYARVLNFLSGKDLYVHDGYYGGDPKYRIPVRVISMKAWHAHYFDNILINPTDAELETFFPEITIINACEYKEYEFKEVGLTSKEFILINLNTKIMVIGGTENSDEMKKGLFSMANFYLPQKGVLTLHCAANLGKEDDVALFLGASESGKTTLSHDPNMRSWHRKLIGDDVHGWSDEGAFNLENGVYAKCLNLSKKDEPDIFNAIRFGAILENVVSNEKREVDYNDSSITTNTRVSYPLDFVHNAVAPGVCGHAQNIIILARDYLGVLPPIARLNKDQAIYYFLNGYTSILQMKDNKPVAVPKFSFCFGTDYLTQRPNIYAELLSQKIERFGTVTYLLNTGYTGGPYGVGKQIPLEETRRIIEAVLDDSFKNSIFEKDPVFGFEVPKQVTGVDNQILNPRNTWENPSSYDEARKALATAFLDNFEAYAQDGPKTGDVIAVKYLYNEYNRLSAAGPHL